MKKIYLLIISLLICQLSLGQTLLFESFDSLTFPPAGWKNIQVSGNGNESVWDRTTLETNPDCSPYSGAGMAKYFCYNLCAGKSATLISPAINLTGIGANTAKVSFWMFRDNSYPTKEDSIDIYINDTICVSSATHLGKIIRYKGAYPAEISTGWHKYSFFIPSSFNGIKNYIIFKATSIFGYNIYIDNIEVSIDNTTNIDISENNSLVNIFPDPTDGNINIEIKDISNAELSIYSFQGQKVFSKIINSSNSIQQIDLSYLPKGTYIIQVINEKNNIIKKLVIQ
jgi:hypothetical protein